MQYLIIVLLSYVFSYFSVFVEIISPISSSGYPRLFIYLFIYLLINYFILNKAEKIIKKLDADYVKIFNVSLFISAIVGFMSTLILNIFTHKTVDAILNTPPIQSIDFIFPLNAKWIIAIFVTMFILSLLINLVYVLKKSKKFGDEQFELLNYTFFFYLTVGIINFVTFFISLISGLIIR